MNVFRASKQTGFIQMAVELHALHCVKKRTAKTFITKNLLYATDSQI